MKPSHITTPRTIAECTWVTGYTRANVPTGDRIAGFVLAVFIGVSVTLVAVYGGFR